MEEAREKDVTVYEVEADYFSTTHATVGAWVAEQWSFPRRLIDVIQYHHRPHLSKVAPMETAIVHFADVLLARAGDSVSRAIPLFPRCILPRGSWSGCRRPTSSLF